MFDLGGGELLLIVLVILVLFGPKKLPELAQSLGKGLREFKRAQREFTEQINMAVHDDVQSKQRSLGVTPPENVVPRPSQQRSPSTAAAPGVTPDTEAPRADVSTTEGDSSGPSTIQFPAPPPDTEPPTHQ